MYYPNDDDRDAKLGFTFASLGLHPVRPNALACLSSYMYIYMR